jgi:hypothetical protein
MIPASKKKSFTELPEGLSNQLKSTFSTEITSEPEPIEQTPPSVPADKKEAPVAEVKTVTKKDEPAPVKPKKNDRNGQINICVPPETKTDWKVLFAKSNVNITQGIIFAVEHLKNEIEKGEVMLTVGGVIKKTVI